ncbi:MAG: glycosyltransferase family 2 protein [Ignavibacteria bacterium]|nr:glycosyltransferase family 2 protein [Ignavibacteria bacterium]
MENLIARVIEKLFIIYFTSYFLIDFLLFLVFLFSFNSVKKKYETEDETSSYYTKASIIVPAYNEEVSIVQCINMLSKLDYPDFEIIIVNDGSKDNTVQTLLNSFNFKVSDSGYKNIISTAEVKSVYNLNNGKVILIDKSNGGKADAINAGINISKGDFVCTIDAD